MKVDRLDHLVLTVASIEDSITFYERVLGMTAETFGEGRRALKFGNQKINLHEYEHEFEPKAHIPTPGSADLCFVTHGKMSDIVAHLTSQDVDIFEGPVARTGATGPIQSVYFRDPDGNLLEVSVYD